MSTPTIHTPLHKGLNKVREFLADLQTFEFGTKKTHRHHDISDDARHLSLTREQAEQADECVELLRQGLLDPDGWVESEVEGLLGVAVMDAVLDTSGAPKKRVSNAVATLGQELSKPLNRWEVHQPVGGLHDRGLPVTFGKVRFYWGDEKTCRALKSAGKRVFRSSPDSPDSKKFYAKHWAEEVDKEIKDKGFCRIIVSARSEKSAFARALRELSLSIDVVNLFANVTIQTGNGGRLYLPGDAHPTSGMSLTLKLDEDKVERKQAISQNSPEFNISSYLAGPFSDFSMDAPTLAKLKKCGWTRASQILECEDKARTEMENRILAAMRWAGRATATELRDKDKKDVYLVSEQAFLLYAIALESLLLKKGGEISYRLSLRGAHLLATKSEYRREVQKDLADLYNVRSEIVHSGSSSVSPDQLERLRSHTKNAIFIMLMRRSFSKIETEKEFQDWFDGRLLR